MKKHTVLAGTMLLATLSLSALAGDLVDPMRPPNAKAASVTRTAGPAPMSLQGIFTRGTSRLAIVDGRVVREGDTVSGALITQIGADRIHYVRGGKASEAHLPQSSIPVRVKSSLQAGQP